MKLVPVLLCFILSTSAISLLRAGETDSAVEARRVALDLAGAFSNDGFKIRDGHWTGAIPPGEAAVVAVNLYAGNQYWFSVGTSSKAENFNVRVYDEAGKPLPTETYEDEEKAAAGFSPTVSGQYFVGIGPVQGEPSTFCLVYSYK
jgi:hypothetical protein